MKLISPHQHSLLVSIFIGLVTVFSVNGSTPALVVRGIWPDAANDKIEEVAVQGDYAYLLGREYLALGSSMSLEVVDISDVKHPVSVGHLALSKGAYYLTVMNNFVLVGNINSSIELIDITDPAKPARLSTHYGSSAKTFHSSRPLVAGGFIYWPNGDYGMEILTIEEAPGLSISKSKVPGSVQVGWERMLGARLQKTRDLANPQWEDVPESAGAAADPIALTEGNAFFRVIKRLP